MNVKSLQTRRFTEQTQEILKEGFGVNLKFNNETVTEAKISTLQEISEVKLNHLKNLRETWGFKKMTLKRSGAGISVKFYDLINAKGIPELT